MYNNFYTMIDGDLLQIQNGSGLSICVREKCTVLAINAQDDTSRTNVFIKLFCVSEILLYAIALRKESSVRWCCTNYKLMKPDWQINGHERGDSWTINEIALHAEEIDYLSQERDSMGVNTHPVFKPFPV